MATNTKQKNRSITDMTVTNDGCSTSTKILQIEQCFTNLIDKTVIFEAANGYGISAKTAALNYPSDAQLRNDRKDDDEFRPRRVRPGVYRFESLSRPKSYLGIDDRTKFDCEKARGCRAVLVGEDDERAYHRAVHALNGRDGFLSFRPFWNPGMVLCHYRTRIWYFDRAAESKEVFVKDCSWKMLPILPYEEQIANCCKFMDSLVDNLVIFEAANGYGLSSVSDGLFKKKGSKLLGEQLTNTRHHNDMFIVRLVQEGIYQFESYSARTGACIGVGVERRTYGTTGYEAVMVKKTDPAGYFRVVPPKNKKDLMLSFESVSRPEFMMNHCHGKMWFFGHPAYEGVKKDAWDVFAADSSWFLLTEGDIRKSLDELQQWKNLW